MDKVLRQRTTVLPGGKVEIVSPELEAGQTVEVQVRCFAPVERRSVVDILAEAPGHRLFKTAKEVDDYLKEMRGC